MLAVQVLLTAAMAPAAGRYNARPDPASVYIRPLENVHVQFGLVAGQLVENCAVDPNTPKLLVGPVSLLIVVLSNVQVQAGSPAVQAWLSTGELPSTGLPEAVARIAKEGS
jgi:hypothetical protein